MTKLFEATIFCAMALALLVAGFAMTSKDGGEVGGSGGDSLISITAATPTVAAMVETWTRPVETATQAVTEIAPVQQPTLDLPNAPKFELAQAPTKAVQVQIFQPDVQEELVVDVIAPPPEPKPEPIPEPEPESLPVPEPRPEPEAKPEPAPAPKPKKQKEVIEKAEKAQESSAGRAAQQAAGSGGGKEAGSASTAQVASSTPGQQQKMLQVWGSKVRSSVARRKRAPRGNHGKGTATVMLTVSRDGRLLSHKILRSSGKPVFDQAALRAVTSVSRYPKAPKKWQGNQFSFTIPLAFE